MPLNGYFGILNETDSNTHKIHYDNCLTFDPTIELCSHLVDVQMLLVCFPLSVVINRHISYSSS